MASAGVIWSFDDKEVQERLGGMIDRLDNLEPVLHVIAEIGVTSISRNFEEGGRPKWPELKEPTIEARRVKGSWPGQILVVKGELSNISADVDDDKVTFSPGAGADDYAAIHHFGGQTGRDRKVEIPERAYLMFQDEDEIEIKAVLTDFIMEGL